MKTAPFPRHALPKYQILRSRSSSKTLFVILIWPRDKNITYTDSSSTAHNFYEKLSCQLLQLETDVCTLNMWIMERFFVCLFWGFLVCGMLETWFPFACVYLQDTLLMEPFELLWVARPSVDYIRLENNTYVSSALQIKKKEMV